MAKIVIYTTNNCPFCVNAKKLLNQKKVKYTEIDITANTEKQTQMVKLTGGSRSVPQIFINDELIGGFDRLSALNASGKLDDLLGQEGTLS